MSEYIVSARKYRPRRFDEVVGQAHVTATLKNAIQQGQIAHAYLFCGPRGVGKTTCARILAKTVNCSNIGSDSEACGECPSCKSFESQSTFNVIELDAASHNSVEHIRTLNEQVRFQPQQGRYKVFIIDEVHMLSSSAFNAFLKTLEEPPPYAIFILATTEKHKIIPTILSRCQIYDFRRIQIPQISGHLSEICKKEKIEAGEDALHIIAEKADGSLRDSLTILDRMASFGNKKILYEDVLQNLNVLDYDYYFKFVDAFLSEDRSLVLKLFREVTMKGFEPEIFISGLAEHFRNLLVCTDKDSADLLQVTPGLADRYQAQSEACSASFILSALDLLNQCGIEYQRAANRRLHTEIFLMKITYLNRLVDPQADTPLSVEEKSEKKKQKPRKRNVTGTAKEESEDDDDEMVEIIRQPPTKSLPALSDLAKIEKEILVVEKEAKSRAKPLTLASIQEIWEDYTGQIDSPSLRNVLRSTKLSLDTRTIHCTVDSEVSREMIQQEVKLMDRIRKDLHENRILLRISVDSAGAKEKKSKKVMTNKEKYEALRASNPLVEKLKDTFDLKVDHGE